MKKYKEYFIIIFAVLLAYIVITIYGYYNDPNPPNKYSWLIALIIVIPFTIFFILIERKRQKKKINIKNKLEKFLAGNNSTLLYFKYTGKVFRYETFYVHINYKNTRYEFWTENGKIYFGRMMIFDYLDDKDNVEVIDLMIKGIKEQLFDKEII